MATRANIVVKDEFGEIYFYRHYDGQPKNVKPILEKFVNLIRQHMIRRDAEQSSGWLIIFGMEEFYDNLLKQPKKGNIHSDLNWKVGTIEPAIDLHTDTDYTYIIDLTNPNAEVYYMKGYGRTLHDMDI